MKPAENNEAVLLNGPIGRQLVKLSMPMLAGILAMMGFNMIDTLFVGRLGTMPLAAMAITFPVVMIVASVSLGLGISTSIAVSRAIGRNSDDDMKRLTTDSLLLSLVICVAFMLLGLANLDQILYMLEGDLPVHDLAKDYLQIWFLGLPFFVIPLVGNMAIRATGDTATPGAVIIISSILNAVLDPLFIYGLGPFPALGIAGAAWATVIARCISFVIVMYILFVRDRMLASPFVPIRRILDSWRKLLRNGVPIAINNLMTPLQMGVLTRLSASIGAGTVAGFGVATRVESFALTAFFALQAVVGIFVGQNAGAARWDRVKRGMKLSERFAFIYGAAVFVVLIVIGRPVTALFNPDPAVWEAARWYYLLVGLTFAVRGLYLVGSAGLNSLNRAADSTIITALHGLIIAVPAAWFMGRLWGAAGLFAGIAVGNIAGGIITAVWLRRSIRRDEVAR